MTETTFLWHDFETFGADPRRDRPAQFAALRTNDRLEPVDKPIVIYCKPADDVLPQPMACLITGITPQVARDRGLPENEFAERIHDQMSRADTCSVGYNNFRFDDEVTRHLFWRNFFDPYAREYANGNSRFDLIDLMRMTRALRPEGISWADRDDGTPSFRLEDLAAANGMDTSRAHDALADVEATLGLARLVREHQPRLWQWALGLRRKHTVANLLEKRQPLLHSSARFPASACGTAPILPLAPHPGYAGQWIVWNLNISPEPFAKLSVEQLADRLWTSAEDLPEDMERLPVKLVRTNRCPMLSPLSVLDTAAGERLGINQQHLDRHATRLTELPDLIARISELYAPQQRATGTTAPDPELALYDGFVPRGDQQVYPAIRRAGPDELSRLGNPFTDERLNHLLFRYRARLFPDSLNADEQQRWADERQHRLVSDPELASIRWPEFQVEVAERLANQPEHRDILEALMDWAISLGLRKPG